MKLILCILLSPALAWAQEFQQLHAELVSATSFLQSNWNKYQENYHPNYAFDGNPKTAWVEGAEGLGEGQSLEWNVSRLETVTEVKLRVRNGYQKSATLLKANGSLSEATLILIGKQPTFQTAQKLTLKNEMGWQEFTVTLEENHGLTGLKLVVDKAHDGKTYRDTCVSDVEVWVKSKVPYNAAAEKEKFARLRKWTAERLKAAKFFANAPATYPFASAKFLETSSRDYYPAKYKDDYPASTRSDYYDKEPPVNFQYATDLNEVIALQGKYGVKRGEKSGWNKMVVDRSKVTTFAPDGLQTSFVNVAAPDYHTDVIMHYMGLQNLAFFEAKGEIARVDARTSYDQTYRKTLSNVQLHREEGKIKAVAFWVETSGQERGPYKYTNKILLTYLDDRLQWAIVDHVGLKFTYDKEGKVVQVLTVGHDTSDHADAPYYWRVFDADITKLAGKK